MNKRKFDENDEQENDENLNRSIDLIEIDLEDSSTEIIEENFNNEFYFSNSIEDIIEDQSSEKIKDSSDEEVQNIDIENLVVENGMSKIFFEKQSFRKSLKNLIVKFLNTFDNKKYIKLIKKMCAENGESLFVSFMDISNYNEILLKLLDLYPEKTIEIMDTGVESVVKNYFPNYNLIKTKLHCRIVDLPVLENIRSLRNNHLNKLVRLCGVVTRRTGIFPLFYIIKYTCLKCKATFGPFIANINKPSHCYECQSKGPFTINSAKTIYKDFQKISIQEVPGSVPPGTLPRAKDVLLFYDLIDSAKPGEEIEIIGIYKNNFNIALNIKNGFPVFFTVIEAISINKNVGKVKLTEEDIAEIKKYSKNPNIKNILYNSIAPDIFGHFSIKRAIAIALFSGVPKEKDNHKIRGDINVLLLGDPGTAKSQFLRYIEKTSNRAVMATGQGASAVGLTATVRRDPVLKEWTLEGGALVLADKGVCLIDEFDKMNEHDRTSIHEAMEQQSISVSKAGIVATLHARCTVIAAANPLRGMYNASLTFAQNVNLSDPILSRFDILCVVRDIIDLKEDVVMAGHILKSHKGKRDHEGVVLDHNFLRKYILYAKSNVAPVLSHVNVDKISNLYTLLRSESNLSGLPITVRHIEAMIRISEALAKMELRSYVTFEDVDEAIAVVLDSFMGAQKYSVSKSMRRKFLKYFKKSNIDVVIFVLKELFNEKIKAYKSDRISVNELERQLTTYGLSMPSNLYATKEFTQNGFIYDKEANLIKRCL